MPAPFWYNCVRYQKGVFSIYRQEIIQDVSLFTSQSAAAFYDKLFQVIDFELPHASTGRKGFPKEAMLCAFIVMKCEGFSQITDLADYLENNRIIAHFCGFNIMKPLPSYWTYDRFLRKLNNSYLKEVMASLVQQLYELYRPRFHPCDGKHHPEQSKFFHEGQVQQGKATQK